MEHTIRRVVTGHDASGSAVIWKDERFAMAPIGGGIAWFGRLWSTDRSPADNSAAVDGALRETGLTCPGGTVLRVVDIPPGARSPMHRTHSIDYGIVLEGEIVLELDEGRQTRVRAGEVIVQRGTNHAWINDTDRTTRIAFVLVDARPLEFGGQELPATL